MAYVLGNKSRANLVGVHPDLVRIVQAAITITTQDFSVFEGLRSADRQKRLFDQGRSKIDGVTKRGQHMRGADGYGHAVDLVPYVDGELCWEWDLYYPICDAVLAAAKEQSTPVRWGGTWTVITNPEYDGLTAKEMYLRRPSWDGAHYELPSRIYR